MPRIPAVLLLASLLVGCASPGPRDLGGWLEARGADVLDTIGLRLTAGPGFGIYVRATEYLQFGYMAVGPSEGELPRPEGEDLRGVPCFVTGLRGRYGGAWFEQSEEILLPALSSRDVVDEAIRRETLGGYITPHGEYDDWRYEFGVGVHAVLIGVQAEVRPHQVLDLVLGLLGFDILGDDIPRGTVQVEDQPEEDFIVP